VFGAVGDECEKMTSFLDNLFGVKTRKHKEEYYESVKDDLADGLPSGHCG
jgi:hypothetical protein